MVALSSLGGGGGSGGGTPKVLFNGTLTSVDLTGLDTWTLYTNDATTTSVVEGVLIDDSVTFSDADGVAVTGTFINDTVTIGKTESLAGSEITAPSTSLVVKLDTPLVLDEVGYSEEGYEYVAASSTTLIRTTTKTDTINVPANNYLINQSDDELIVKYFDATYTGGTSTNGSFSVPTMQTPRWFYATDNFAYYFYSDGNQSNYIYKAVNSSGTIGAWSAIATPSYGYMALDIGKKKVFYVTGGTIHEVDLVTGVDTTIKSSGVTNTSTYSTAGAANGVFFFSRSSGHTGYLYSYDTNTGIYYIIYVPTDYSTSTYPHLGVCYNPTENKYYISIGSSENSRVYSVDWATKSVVYLGAQDDVYPDGLGNSYALLGNDQGEMFITAGTGYPQTISFKNDVATVTSQHTIGGSWTISSNGAWYKKPLAAIETVTLALEDYTINLKCKVSGTEYKEG
jgi:hypothetical protein